MSDSIELLIKQAELQKLRIQLSHRYEKNITLFQKHCPEVTNQLKKQASSTIELRIDSHNDLNLYHKHMKAFVYDDSPMTLCERQAKEYKESPFGNRVRIRESEIYNNRHLHLPYLNDLISEYEAEDKEHVLSSDGIITNLMMTGVGLGYHIPILLRDLNIFNLFIYESNIDVFNASLKTIDWSPIFEYFSQSDRSITFCIGQKPHIALHQIEKNIWEIGLHNHVYTFIYKHTNLPEEEAFFKYYLNNFHSSIGGLGYYDDEQISFAHTAENIKSELPVLITSKEPNEDLPPAIIIGNGPSLDIHEDFLRKNAAGAVLFSCGTSLGSLSKFGIRPDFHVEMERTISMKDILDFGTTEEYRKNITLLCLNTVSPDVIKSFDNTCIGLKPNDVGEKLMVDRYHPQKITTLHFSNPTVTNCALSFAISMGFNDVYLVGVDLGIKDDGQHHSTKSPHYDLGEHIKDIKEAIYTYSDGNYNTKGNFGGQVVTHLTLDRARHTIERLLHYNKLVSPHFKCFNSNNGAYIEGASPTPISSIKDLTPIDKNGILNRIKKRNFYTSKNKIMTQDIHQTLNYFFSIKNTILIDESISNTRDFYQECQRIYAAINKEIDTTTHMLLGGTVNSFLGVITEHAFHCKNASDFLLQAKKGLKKYNELIKKIYERMEHEPHRLDDTHNPTLYRLNRDKILSHAKK